MGRLPAILPHIEACGARIVIDHFGNPDPNLGLACPSFQAVLRSFDTGRTWVKLSAGYRVGRENAKKYARELLRIGGPERLVWGSDAPFASFESTTTYQQTIDDLADWIRTPQHAPDWHRDSAPALFWFAIILHLPMARCENSRQAVRCGQWYFQSRLCENERIKKRH